MANFIKQLLITLLALSLVVFMVMQLTLTAGVDIEVESAKYASVRDMTEMQCYVYRDETLVEGQLGGAASYCRDDGEKVRKGTELARIYTAAEDADIQDRISAIDERIAVLESSVITEGTSTTDNALVLANIEELRTLISNAILDNDFDAAERYKEQLNIQMNRSKAISQSIYEYDVQIAALKAEKSELSSSLGASYTSVGSPLSGYYFTEVDGYEKQFTLQSLSAITLSGFERLADAVPNQTLINTSCGKIVTSEIWYLLCKTTKKVANAYTAEKAYTIVFPYSSGTELRCIFQRAVTQPDSDDALVIFSCNQMPSGFNYARSQTVQVVNKTYNGLRISALALRMQDGVAGVFVLDGNIVAFKTVDVLIRQGSYYICALPTDPNYPSRQEKSYVSSTQLSLYDIVITSGTGVYEGALIR